MLASVNFGRIEFRGVIDAFNTAFKLNGDVEGMQITPELCDSLPGPIAAKLATIGELRANARIYFRLGLRP